MFKITWGETDFTYDPEKMSFSIDRQGKEWHWREGEASVILTDGRSLDFRDATVNAQRFETGVAIGVKAVYSGFKGCDYSLLTKIYIEKLSGDLLFEIFGENDREGEIEKLYWPAPFDFTAGRGEGYIVSPQMHGLLIPAGWNKEIHSLNGWKIYERDAYMPIYGYVEGNDGFAAIFETPYDGCIQLEHKPGVESYIRPAFRSSLGKIAYLRRIRYSFFRNGDYNDICKIYRSYLINRGMFVTLKEKAVRNPAVAKLPGTPIVHTDIAGQISEKSHYYNQEDLSKNKWAVPFSQRGDELKKLKKRGIERAYLHLDGWGRHGYDNMHPDVFPPNEEAGGAEGMKELSQTCRELGYMFGIHDQYRDYYYDCDSFDLENAQTFIDGSHPYWEVWYGGPQTVLCQALAPDYVRRNYAEFEKLGIRIDGSYLDVFSVVELDECFHSEHRLTRQGSAEKRIECFEILNNRGIISSSEEVTDFAMRSLALCHHAPFATNDFSCTSEAMAIPLPLFSLVYHECIIVPWMGLNNKGGWGIPVSDCAFLYALLCGGTVYVSHDMSDGELDLIRLALKLHKKVAYCEMVKHEFLDNTYRRQRSVFSDGTEVTVDFDNDKFEIKYKD